MTLSKGQGRAGFGECGTSSHQAGPLGWRARGGREDGRGPGWQYPLELCHPSFPS
jgi:hypothetical protein